MSIILSDEIQRECAAQHIADEKARAADELTRRPYLAVTYEMSGTYMILGSIDEYTSDPLELGRVVCELMHDEWKNWGAGQAEERDRLLVEIRELTDMEVANLPEFPGW